MKLKKLFLFISIIFSFKSYSACSDNPNRDDCLKCCLATSVKYQTSQAYPSFKSELSDACNTSQYKQKISKFAAIKTEYKVDSSLVHLMCNVQVVTNSYSDCALSCPDNNEKVKKEAQSGEK